MMSRLKCYARTSKKFSISLIAIIILNKYIESNLLVVAADNNDSYGDNSDYEEGYCAPYNGRVCKSFITTSQVWYSRVSKATLRSYFYHRNESFFHMKSRTYESVSTKRNNDIFFYFI